MIYYFKSKLKAERQSLKEHTDRYGDPVGGTAGALTVRSIKARIAMLEEIMTDLDLTTRNAVILSVNEPRPAFEPSEAWKQRNDPDHTHCTDCGDLIDSASKGCQAAGDGHGCKGFE